MRMESHFLKEWFVLRSFHLYLKYTETFQAENAQRIDDKQIQLENILFYYSLAVNLNDCVSDEFFFSSLLHIHRSISIVECGIAEIGVARVGPNTIVAIFVGVASQSGCKL